MNRRSSFIILAVFTLLVLFGTSFRLSMTAKALSSASELDQSASLTPTSSPTPIAPITAGFSTVKKTVSLVDLGRSNDETLQGVTVTRTYGMRWPNSWVVMPGNSVTILFSHSPALASYSSMGVDFNGVRIGSVMLTPQNSDQGSATFLIPNNIIRVGGYNSLDLQLFMGIHDNYCDDLDNPGVWTTIHSATSFVLSYRAAAPVPDLGQYPFPLLNGSELLVNQLTLVTPDKPNDTELNAVAVISAKLGQLNSYFNLNLDVIPESRMSTDVVAGNIMYVGQAAHLKMLTSEAFPFISGTGQTITFVSLTGAALDPDDGILWEDVSPSDPTAVRLIVTGQTEEALTKAARSLANDGVYPRLVGQLGIIKSVAESGVVAGAIPSMMTFSDLGYQDESALGTLQQTVSYTVPLSREWQVYTEGILNLHFAHSALLDSQGSTLQITVNGTPVGSVALDADSVQDGKATFSIPARLFEIGNNSINVTTDLRLPYDPQDQYYCDRNHYNAAWVTVYSDSTLTLPSGPTSLHLDLQNYPFGFIGLSDLSDLAFVVPDTSSSETAQALAWIAAGLGRYAQGQELAPKVISASSDSNFDKSVFTQIILGTPSGNPAITQLNSILPLPFAVGQDTPLDPTKLAQIVPAINSGSIGYIQSALSENNQPRLVVTGNSPEGVLWAAKGLYDQTLLRFLKQNLAVFEGPTQIYTTAINPRVASAPALSPTPISSSSALSPVTTTSWILWLAGGLFLVTFIILIFLVRSTLVKRR